MNPLAGLVVGDNEFRLHVPNADVKQGETKTINVSIERGKNFDQDVKLSFSKEPMGVKITPDSNEIKAGAKDVQVKIEASKDAALGDHMVTLTGTPMKSGAATSVDFKVSVKQP